MHKLTLLVSLVRQKMMQIEEEEEEAILLEFSENNYSNYYVQSPSSVSYANYITTTTTITETELLSRNNTNNPQFPLITTPNYRHSPLQKHDHQSMSSATAAKQQRKIDEEDNEEDNYEEENNNIYNGGGKSSSYGQYFSFDTYPSSYIWIALQLLWRLLVSLMLAFLVFYIITKPPPPLVSLQVTGVNQFELTQGLDSTGVATTFLGCNISMALTIENKSKVFGLHILSPMVNVYFDRVSFVLSQGPRVDVKSREWKEMEVYAGTNKKAMYGGGRNMEDLLNSGRGLPLLVTLTFSSYFRVVANLIHSHFHHHAQCLLVLHNMHHTPAYNSTCLVTS